MPLDRIDEVVTSVELGHRCLHCEFYSAPKDSRMCEACTETISLCEVFDFYHTGAKDWVAYHLVREGDLDEREALEDNMRRRLVSEGRCQTPQCGKKLGPGSCGKPLNCLGCRRRLAIQDRSRESVKERAPSPKPKLDEQSSNSTEGPPRPSENISDYSGNKSPGEMV
ncbi:hypothetical protein FDECE_9172 [Fusarium decemcellulare]|nr:hypothetical protein FDECE_9172 [Fusarium decemcellulare]